MTSHSLEALNNIRQKLLTENTISSSYVARDRYLQNCTWLQVPVHDKAAGVDTHISVLTDSTFCAPLLSSIICKISIKDLQVEPQGDCIHPAEIAAASLRIWVSSPRLSKEIDDDFNTACQRLKDLALSSGVFDMTTKSDCITFYHPVLVDKQSVSLWRPFQAVCEIDTDNSKSQFSLGCHFVSSQSVSSPP